MTTIDAATPQPGEVPSPLDSFSGKISPTRVSPFYQFGLSIVAVAMLMLPLIYVAIIVSVGGTLWWHIENNTYWFERARGRGALWMFGLYLAPIIIGVIFILFLIKPLFSRPAKRVAPFRVLPEAEPQLFAFIQRICDLVGAPRPKEVSVDCQVNASASFRRGWWSLLGNDLRLTIGMPLLAGMTMRQVAGVLAHEFGHFAQGAGMRFSYVIRGVNNWFSRVVYERDTWDEKLDEWARDTDWRLMIVLKCAQAGVWVGRKILWVLMMAGHFISCFMARQMEYDADSYEAKVAGSEEFPKTAQRLRFLGAAAGAAMADAQSQFRQRQLPDDLPTLVAWRESNIPEDVRKRIEDSTIAEKTRWHHTHPADADRNKAVLALNAPGVFHLERPATELLSDFANLSRAATRHYYQQELELDLGGVALQNSEKSVADRGAADEADGKLELFFGQSFDLLRMRPVALTEPAAWSAAHTEMASMREDYCKTLVRLVAVRRRLSNLTVAKDLLSAQYRLSTPTEFDLTESSIECAIRTFAVTEAESRTLADSMAAFETAAWTRLACGLSFLLGHNDSLAPMERERLLHLIQVQGALSGIVGHLATLGDGCKALEMLFANARGHQNGTVLQAQIDVVIQRLEEGLQRIKQALEGIGHPYLEDRPPILSLLPEPRKDAIRAARAHDSAEAVIQLLPPLLARVCGDLAGYALTAEQSLSAAAAVPATLPPVATDEQSIPGAVAPVVALDTAAAGGEDTEVSEVATQPPPLECAPVSPAPPERRPRASIAVSRLKARRGRPSQSRADAAVPRTLRCARCKRVSSPRSAAARQSPHRKPLCAACRTK